MNLEKISGPNMMILVFLNFIKILWESFSTSLRLINTIRVSIESSSIFASQ